MNSTTDRRAFVPGCGQLTLVEHALCPLDSRVSLREGFWHSTTFAYSDAQRRRRTARVDVSCPRGLSSHDEFYLWGLLALTLDQSPPEAEFHATPHFVLRELGLVDSGSRRGGRQYQQFAAAVERLAWVRYGCDAFYDPVRAEHCQVRFGFFSYRLPLDPQSNRAWRFHWDTQFLEFVRAAGGSLRFDLQRYRRLGPSARRLFLFLGKVFARSGHTPRMELRQVTVDLLGLSPKLPTKHLLAKFRNVCDELAAEGVIMELTMDAIQRRAKGDYLVLLRRGQAFARQWQRAAIASESPLAEPLRTIGLDEPSVRRVLRQFTAAQIREWADITLAAQEKFGSSFFKRSPAAYFLDNLKKSVSDGRTPPDWWHEVRKAEETRQAERDRRSRRPTEPLERTSRAAFDAIRDGLFQQLCVAGLDEATATREAQRRAQQQLRARPAKDASRADEVLAALPLKLV